MLVNMLFSTIVAEICHSIEKVKYRHTQKPALHMLTMEQTTSQETISSSH